MKKREKTILFTLGGLLVLLVIYVTASLWTSDGVLSIVPGWHTTIYPPEITWSALAAIILAIGITVYLVFRGMIKLLTVLWERMRS